jgi:hypothetical protein
MLVRSRRPPSASDAEIRAYLLPLLRAGRRPTYATMRAELGGGGYSRLVRVRKQIEKELVGADSSDVQASSTGHSSVDDLLGRLEEVLERQLEAFNASNLNWRQHFENAAKAAQPSSSKRGTDAGAIPIERLEATMRRILTTIEEVQGALQNLDRVEKNVPVSPLRFADAPTLRTPQVAATTTSAIDERLQSLEESIRSAMNESRSAYQSAADVARTVTFAGPPQLQQTVDEPRSLADDVRSACQPTAAEPNVIEAVRSVKDAVERTAARAAAVADHRAGAVAQALVAFTDLHALQIELISNVVQRGSSKASSRANRTVLGTAPARRRT